MESSEKSYYDTQQEFKDPDKIPRMIVLTVLTVIFMIVFFGMASNIGVILAMLIAGSLYLPVLLAMIEVINRDKAEGNTGEMEELFRKNITNKYNINQIEGQLDPRIMHQQDIIFYCGDEKFKAKVWQKRDTCEPFLSLDHIPLR